MRRGYSYLGTLIALVIIIFLFGLCIQVFFANKVEESITNRILSSYSKSTQSNTLQATKEYDTKDSNKRLDSSYKSVKKKKQKLRREESTTIKRVDIIQNITSIPLTANNNVVNNQVSFESSTVLLIIASNRYDYLKQTLDNVIKYHPRQGIPIVISEDGHSNNIQLVRKRQGIYSPTYTRKRYLSAYIYYIGY